MMSKMIKGGRGKPYLARSDGRIWSEEQFWIQFIDTVLQIQKVPPCLQLKWNQIFCKWSREMGTSFSPSLQKSLQIYFHFIRRTAMGETGPKRTNCKFITTPIVEKMHQYLSFTGTLQSREPEEQLQSGDREEEEKDRSGQSFIAPSHSTFVPSPKRDRKQFETDDVRFMKEQLDELQLWYDNVVATAYGRTCQILTSNGNMGTTKKMRFSESHWARREFQELRGQLIALVKETTHTISFNLKKDA